MKVLLTTLNSKFIHSSLALRYLMAFCKDKPWHLKLREFTINNSIHTITGEIYKEKPRIVAFSCYIWNITETMQVARRVRQVMEDTVIILGGPEVSYDTCSLMEQYDFIDFIVRGEGEETFRELLEHIVEGKGRPEDIPGITYRSDGSINKNHDRDLIANLESIPFPYDLEHGLENRIVYYEASRGCPFQCQYCLSSTIKGVRFFPVQRVKEDLDRLIGMGVKQVKFVDRTFNCNSSFSREIFSHIIESGGHANFHFEISAHLLDGELLELIGTARPGLLQFEVGVQTTNPSVLKEIRRQSEQEVLFRNVRKISQVGNIHQHLDLIAGLPGEDMASFANSFNDVLSLEPDMLQLGFLKLLKGSGIRERAAEYGYVFTKEPPYEVLGSNWMNFGDLRRLKLVEEVLEYFYNSHSFDYTLKFILSGFSAGSFDFYKNLSEYWEDRGLHLLKHGRRELFSLFFEYCKRQLGAPRAVINELLKLDFLVVERSLTLPSAIRRLQIPYFKQRCFDFLCKPENIETYLPGYAGLSPKQITKLVHFEVFDPCISDYVPLLGDKGRREEIVVLFDYRNGDRLRGKARIRAVEI